MKIVGLMSGTSGDGVDAALVDISGRGGSLKVRTLAAQTLGYPDLSNNGFSPLPSPEPSQTSAT